MLGFFISLRITPKIGFGCRNRGNLTQKDMRIPLRYICGTKIHKKTRYNQKKQ